MSTTNPALLTYTMPDQTTRRPIFDRLDGEGVKFGHWELNEDTDCPAYHESRDLTVAALASWLARTITGGVRVNFLPGPGTWEAGHRTFSPSYTGPTRLAALLLAAHSYADDEGIDP